MKAQCIQTNISRNQQPTKIKANNNVQQQKQHFRFSWSQGYNFLQKLFYSRQGFFYSLLIFKSDHPHLFFFWFVCKEEKKEALGIHIRTISKQRRRKEKTCEKKKSSIKEAIKDKRIYQKK